MIKPHSMLGTFETFSGWNSAAKTNSAGRATRHRYTDW
jgi:hypothetical protein